MYIDYFEILTYTELKTEDASSYDGLQIRTQPEERLEGIWKVCKYSVWLMKLPESHYYLAHT